MLFELEDLTKLDISAHLAYLRTVQYPDTAERNQTTVPRVFAMDLSCHPRQGKPEARHDWSIDSRITPPFDRRPVRPCPLPFVKASQASTPGSTILAIFRSGPVDAAEAHLVCSLSVEH